MDQHLLAGGDGNAPQAPQTPQTPQVVRGQRLPHQDGGGGPQAHRLQEAAFQVGEALHPLRGGEVHPGQLLPHPLLHQGVGQDQGQGPGGVRRQRLVHGEHPVRDLVLHPRLGALRRLPEGRDEAPLLGASQVAAHSLVEGLEVPRGPARGGPQGAVALLHHRPQPLPERGIVPRPWAEDDLQGDPPEEVLDVVPDQARPGAGVGRAGLPGHDLQERRRVGVRLLGAVQHGLVEAPPVAPGGVPGDGHRAGLEAGHPVALGRGVGVAQGGMVKHLAHALHVQHQQGPGVEHVQEEVVAPVLAPEGGQQAYGQRVAVEAGEEAHPEALPGEDPLQQIGEHKLQVKAQVVGEGEGAHPAPLQGALPRGPGRRIR